MQVNLEPQACNIFLENGNIRSYHDDATYTDYYIYSGRAYPIKTGKGEKPTTAICITEKIIAYPEWQWQIPVVSLAIIASVWLVLYYTIFRRLGL